jgi:hypothetical protein
MLDLSLNDVVESLREWYGFKLELDTNISKIYPDKEARSLVRGIGNLAEETKNYRGSEKKAITKLEKGVQVLELLSSGSPLDQKTIDLLNERYKTGRTTEIEPHRNGSMIAGYYLSKINGEVYIENCNEGIYTVRNVVKLPS